MIGFNAESGTTGFANTVVKPSDFIGPRWLHTSIRRCVRNCGECTRKILKLRKRTNLLNLFPEKDPFVSVGIYILGYYQRQNRGRRFLLLITDRCTMMTQALPLRKIDFYTVARDFADEWVFKYGSP